MENSALVTYITTKELTPRLDGDTSLYLLDVREPDEVADWKIEGVHNIPVGELSSHVDELPRDKDIVVICAKGGRALQAAELLATHGVASEILEGGMSSWASTYDYVEGDFGGATVIQVRRRGKGCLSYVIGAGETAVVIDPSLDIDQYIAIATEHFWKIAYVVDTHLHADHISGARSLVARTGAALWLNPADPFAFAFEPLVDGRAIELKPGVHLTVASVSVPGHTEGSTMYQLGDHAIFTGDTLFLESVGRPDLAEQAEAFAHNLFHSLHDRVLPLNDGITVFPAHYGAGVEVHSGVFVSRPLGELRHSLPALALGEDDFVTWAVANVKDRPPNYQSIVLVNAGRQALSGDIAELELGPNRCAIG